MSLLLQQYQSRVLSPTEIVDYSVTIMQGYPPQAIAMEPFIGFKVLCRDTNAHMTTPAARLNQIDANLGFLRGKGCIIRETAASMPDGFWIISMPVPRSQVQMQVNNLMDVLATFEKYFGIIRQGIIEINVSGRCTPMDTERCLSGLMIPPRFAGVLIQPDNSAYRNGNVVPINDNFICFRTRWNLKVNPTQLYEDVLVLSQLISSIY